jgi:hypothetical protein
MTATANDLLIGPTVPANGVTTIAVDFLVEDETWLEVYKSGSEVPLVLSTDYTFTGEGTDSGEVTLTTPANGTDSYSVYLVQPKERSSDLQFSGGVRSGPLNLELDRLWRAIQGLDTGLLRTLNISKVSAQVDPLDTETTAERADRALAFSSDGSALVTGPTVQQLSVVEGIAADITTVASISADVTTVADDVADVSTVAGGISNVSTVAGISTDVTTLAGIEADVTTLAGISADVTTVAGISSDVEAAEANAAAAAASAAAAAASEVNLDLGPISDTIADTAVDVFIYDTSKDSDGGAWRERTQGTSWYNETLNTATRGSRREFPAVAVIVAETTKVTIYDGDDPSLPMWRVTNQIAGTLPQFFRSGYAVTAVAARNGAIYWGANIGSDLATNGVCFLSFVGDYAGRYGENASHNGVIRPLTADQSTTATLDLSLPLIVDGQVNDVAVTVLPDAPVDPATGLQVPTVAVATDGGVSVIKDDGTVFDITNYGQTPTAVGFTNISGTQQIITQGRFSGWSIILNVPTGDVSLGTTAYFNRDDSSPLSGTVTAYASTGEDIIVGKNVGLLRVLSEPSIIGNSQNSPELRCDITSTYNTGWMQGDIELSLCDGLTDRSVTGTTVTDNGTAAISSIGGDDSQKQITATGGTITATVTTGGSIYGWEKVSGTWYYRDNSGWSGVSESGGTLTISDGTTFAMLRYTNGSGPSSDQHTKVENDEKQLILDGADCLLFGASNAVTALADDPVTDLLHVGTSAGRSDFQGLRRVSNTTTAVTTAISANDGLIVEQ